MQDWITRTCPICDSSRIPTTPIVKAQTPAETLSFGQVKDSFVGLRKDQVFFSYFRCQECQLVFAPWYFSKAQLDELYGEMPDNLMGEDKGTISKTQSGYVKWLRTRLKRVESYLELGPDIGLVSREVVNSYTIKSAVMIEPNTAVYSELKESLLKVDDVKIFRDLQEIYNPIEADLIAGIHVYDHLLDPANDLRRLKNFASEKSSLLIVVHDESSKLRKIMGAKWPPFCLQHPQLFNPETLENLLLGTGWKTVTWSKSVNWWHLNHFAKLGSEVLGISSRWTSYLPKIQFPVKLGNLISLATNSK